MSDKPQFGLQKTDPSQVQHLLPIDLTNLPEETQIELRKKAAEKGIDLIHQAQERLMISRVAEHDLSMVTQHVQALDHERKIYSVHEKLETGSGKVDVTIRGGDTKFLIPILVVIGCIILGLALIFSSK